jgi:hypothetical protein
MGRLRKYSETLTKLFRDVLRNFSKSKASEKFCFFGRGLFMPECSVLMKQKIPYE